MVCFVLHVACCLSLIVYCSLHAAQFVLFVAYCGVYVDCCPLSLFDVCLLFVCCVFLCSLFVCLFVVCCACLMLVL